MRKKTVVIICYLILVLLPKNKQEALKINSIALHSDRIIGQDQFNLATSLNDVFHKIKDNKAFEYKNA
jgi:hypothetical protein